MAAAVNWYKADLRELSFVLLEQFRLGELLGKAPYEPWGEEEAKAILDATYRFAREVLGPLNAEGLQGRLEAALRERLQDTGRRLRARRTGRPEGADRPRGGAALRRQPGVQHVPRPGVRSGRDDHRVRHPRA